MEKSHRLKRFTESVQMSWRLLFSQWTKKDTIELAISIVSGICGSLLCLLLAGVI